MNQNQKGQGLTEFAMILPLLIFIFLAIFAGSIVFLDWALANDSAGRAAHQAAIHIIDGSGKTCLERVLEARGNPRFIGVESATFSIDPCEDDPLWVGMSGETVVAKWELAINPPVPLFYSSGVFPLNITVRFQDTFR